MKFTAHCKFDRPERFRLFMNQLNADGARVETIVEYPTGKLSGRYEKHVIFINATCAIMNANNEVITVKFLRPANLKVYNRFDGKYFLDLYNFAHRNEKQRWCWMDR